MAEALEIPCSANDARAACVARAAGLELCAAKNFKEALAQFEKACALERRNSVNFELCAASMLPLGAYTLGEARGKLQRALELNAYSPAAYALLAQLALAKAGAEVSPKLDLNVAREVFANLDAAYRLDPRDAHVAAQRTEVECVLLQASVEPPVFKGAVSAEAARLRAQAAAAVAKKKFPEAFNLLRQAIEAEPDNSQNYALRARVLCKLKAKGNPAEAALQDARQAVRLAHGNPDAWAAMAMAYHKLGKMDWALDAWDECDRHDIKLVVLRATEKERDKLKKDSAKTKGFARHGTPPWTFSEKAVVALAGTDEARAEHTLEMDSMGAMTIRSQLKRVMMSGKPALVNVGAHSPRAPDASAPRPASPRGQPTPSLSLSPSTAVGDRPPAPAARSPNSSMSRLPVVAPAAGPPQLPPLPPAGTAPSDVVTPTKRNPTLQAMEKLKAMLDEDDEERQEAEPSGGTRVAAPAATPAPAPGPTGPAVKAGWRKSPHPGATPAAAAKTGADTDEDLERFCRLIGGRVTRYEASLMSEGDIPPGLSLPDKLFVRGFVASLQDGGVGASPKKGLVVKTVPKKL